MSVVADFSYDYVFSMVSRLTPEEQERLVREMPSVSVSKPETSYSSEEFYRFLLSGPVIDEEHVQMMRDAREEINRCQPISW